MSRSSMRWTFFVLVVLSIPAAGVVSAARAGGVRWGVVAGAHQTEFVGGSTPIEGNARRTTHGLGGMRIEGPLAGALHWALEPQYLPLADRQDYSIVFAGIGGDLRMEWEVTDVVHTLAIPMRLDWHAGWLRAGAGPGVRILLHATRDVGAPTGEPVATRQERPAANIFEEFGTRGGRSDATEAYLGAQVSAEGLLGAAFPWAAHEGRVELRWSEGLTGSLVGASSPRRARSVQLGLGLLW